MRSAKVLIVATTLAMTLAACSHSDAPPQHSAWAEPTGTLPPLIFSDCADFVLLDDRCVRAWYACTRGADRAACGRVWEACCTLPGRGKRSSLASVKPVER